MKTLEKLAQEIKLARKDYSKECTVSAVLISNICDRALSLIDLVQEKDFLLEDISECWLTHGCNCQENANQALELTEKFNAKDGGLVHGSERT